MKWGQSPAKHKLHTRRPRGKQKRHARPGGATDPVRAPEPGSAEDRHRDTRVSPAPHGFSPAPRIAAQAAVKTSEQLVPPKPKLLASAAPTFLCTGTLGVTFKPSAATAGSSSWRLIVGGTQPS